MLTETHEDSSITLAVTVKFPISILKVQAYRFFVARWHYLLTWLSTCMTLIDRPKQFCRTKHSFDASSSSSNTASASKLMPRWHHWRIHGKSPTITRRPHEIWMPMVNIFGNKKGKHTI
jgi:hypothetical protein